MASAYHNALAQARKAGAAHATGDAYLAQTVAVVTIPHPGLNPAMVFEGARKRGLKPKDLLLLDGLALDDLMWATE